MIIHKLPSPVVAQRYRVDHLYEGPTDDQTAVAIRECNSEGPLSIFISKMIPDKNRFFAFGRVFSGTVRAGQRVRIQGPNYIPGSKTDLYVQNVQRVCINQGGKFEGVPEVPCGNTVALVGIDNCLVK
jgi:elongation factor 2